MFRNGIYKHTEYLVDRRVVVATLAAEMRDLYRDSVVPLVGVR
jgi:hypothetical protein